MAGRYRKYDYGAVVEFIAAYTEQHGRPPTIREIGAGCGIPSTSNIAHILNALEAAGEITKDKRVSRGVRAIPAPAQ